MKERLVELGKTLIIVVLAILIISLVFWGLGAIVIKIFEAPITLTYLQTIGFTICILIIRGIAKFFIEGFDIEEVLKKCKKQGVPNKTYKFTIAYKNNMVTKGTLTANNLNEVSELLLRNNANFIDNGKKLVYYNNNEIQSCEVEEIEEESQC